MRRADRYLVERGRGAVTNPAGRFEATSLTPEDDGWGSLDEPLPSSVTTLTLSEMPASVTPLVYAIPAQLLAYHAAVHLGTDVDQPRNLAKSVTVE